MSHGKAVMVLGTINEVDAPGSPAVATHHGGS